MITYYTTSDLCTATTLSLWFVVERLERIQDSKKVVFVFRDNTKLQKVLSDYWNGGIKVEPKTFFNNLKVLKGRLYSDE